MNPVVISAQAAIVACAFAFLCVFGDASAARSFAVSVVGVSVILAISNWRPGTRQRLAAFYELVAPDLQAEAWGSLRAEIEHRVKDYYRLKRPEPGVRAWIIHRALPRRGSAALI